MFFFCIQHHTRTFWHFPEATCFPCMTSIIVDAFFRFAISRIAEKKNTTTRTAMHPHDFTNRSYPNIGSSSKSPIIPNMMTCSRWRRCVVAALIGCPLVVLVCLFVWRRLESRRSVERIVFGAEICVLIFRERVGTANVLRCFFRFRRGIESRAFVFCVLRGVL